MRFCPLLVLLLLAGIVPARAENPDVLWHLVNDRCVRNFKTSGSPAPCAEVDLPPDVRSGWVVLKDRDGATQYLVIPTQKITGIEDPAILGADEPNFFGAAWEARHYFLDKVGKPLPRGEISLAINSPYGRSQNQLHIHIDCIRADVAATLAAHLADVGDGWAPLPLAGHAYRARRLDGPDLTVNPFRLLAADTDVGAAGIGKHTLVVVGENFADGRDGFLLLDDAVDVPIGDRASGEELQDHACAVAK
jgi:CDP-diacylglycerol pyrophosphatase